jgi:hypothetical protein
MAALPHASVAMPKFHPICYQQIVRTRRMSVYDQFRTIIDVLSWRPAYRWAIWNIVDRREVMSSWQRFESEADARTVAAVAMLQRWGEVQYAPAASTAFSATVNDPSAIAEARQRVLAAVNDLIISHRAMDGEAHKHVLTIIEYGEQLRRIQSDNTT